MALTAETLVRCGVPAEKARAHLPHIRAAMREHEITTPARARMFLAQVMHESAALQFFEEIWGPTPAQRGYEGRRDLGNVRPGDGHRFKGRGPIQLTGRANYTLYGKLLGLDLVSRPELAATPRVGWRVSALFFQRRGCNAVADRGDFLGVTRLINGGLNGLADRQRFYGLLGGASVLPGRAYIARGDTGDAVVTATRRLSFVRDAERRRYLDGKRARFDREAEEALRAFQADHGLKPDGRYGPRSARALAHATEREKKRRRRRRDAAAPEPGAVSPAARTDRMRRERPRPVRGRATSHDILEALDRLDVRGDRLRAGLLARLRALERARAGLGRDDLDALDAQLARLDPIVHELRETIAAGRKQRADARAPKPAAGKEAVTVAGSIVTQADPAKTVAMASAGQPAAEQPAAVQATVEQPAPEQPGPAEPVAVQPQASPEPTLRELIERLAVLDAEEDRVRAALAEGFRKLERRHRRTRRRLGDEGNGRRPVPAERPRPRPRPDTTPRRGKPGRPPPDDGPGGDAANAAADERSFRIRQSKIALSRFLARNRKQTSRALRRRLRTELRTPGKAPLATPAWEQAVREAQAIAGHPETGKLDGKLTRALRKDWPSEAGGRRLVRGTPAWRLIPGQLSPNFNLREFACNDGTAYIAGLVAEQGLSKSSAKKRANELADRLERLRRREGNRPLHVNSVFRTKAHNARVGGVPNSAHTRGYAADIRPPQGVTIAVHREHVRKVFEGGVGRYATFVHGDFDPSERGQSWNG